MKIQEYLENLFIDKNATHPKDKKLTTKEVLEILMLEELRIRE